MTSERHGVAAKVIATVDDLERIAADDDADVPAPARLATRIVRREGASRSSTASSPSRSKGAVAVGRAAKSAERRRHPRQPSPARDRPGARAGAAARTPVRRRGREAAGELQSSACRARRRAACAAARRASQPRRGRRPASPHRERARDRSCASSAIRARAATIRRPARPTWRKNTVSGEKSPARVIDADKGGIGDDVERLLAAIVGMRPPADIGEQAGGVAQAPFVGGLLEAGGRHEAVGPTDEFLAVTRRARTQHIEFSRRRDQRVRFFSFALSME